MCSALVEALHVLLTLLFSNNKTDFAVNLMGVAMVSKENFRSISRWHMWANRDVTTALPNTSTAGICLQESRCGDSAVSGSTGGALRLCPPHASRSDALSPSLALVPALQRLSHVFVRGCLQCVYKPVCIHGTFP